MGSEATPEWAEQWLEASDGIKMVRVLPAGGIEVTQIPTIVPRLTEGGCVFWTSSGRCAIHEVAPAGCAFFDAHLSPEEADTRSLALALAVRDEQDDVYRQIGSHLWSIGAIARPLHERRENYRVAETDLLDKPTRVQ